MYSYGWRDYIPDIGRWNGIDQLAEKYLSTGTYAYVANNPVSNADIDGRWFNDDGSIDLSGTANGFVRTRSYSQSYLGQYPGQGGGGGGYTFTGNAAASMFDYFANGGDINGISFNKGWATWWMDGTLGYSNNGETVITGLIGYSFKLFNGGFDSFASQNISYTNTFGNVTDLVSENPFFKAENEFSVTNGNAKILNFDLKNTINVSTLKNDTSLDIQLNLSLLNLNSEFGKSSSSNGATISVGNYSVGVAGTLSYDFWNSDYSVKFGQKLSNSTMSTSTYGVKPASAILAIITYGMARFTPPVLWERPITIPMY